MQFFSGAPVNQVTVTVTVAFIEVACDKSSSNCGVFDCKPLEFLDKDVT